ncbi:MAG: DUF389 domain-containing protein [Acidobacteriota bacterium]
METFNKFGKFLRVIVRLKGGTDAEGTIGEITKNVKLRGVNVWMLVCSAILASIGLDVNSTAVIIGAMLISPLMSPILGVGLGVAIRDRRLLIDALKNLGLATFLSLLTSFIYFFISPLGDATAEINARITPTILDVGVAFFGGVAGIVAGSRRDKTNAIPGVAIATALMPPICVAGFGLAKMSSAVFLGAFYLYFINSVFISLATYLISVMLNFPKHEQIDEYQYTHVKRFIIGFAILVTIPSAFIFYNVLDKLRFNKNVKNFVSTEVRTDNRRPIQTEIVDSTHPKTLKIYTVGQAVSAEEKQKLEDKLVEYGIGGMQIKLVQLNVSPDEFERLTSDVQTNLSDKLGVLQSSEDEQKSIIEVLKAQIADLEDRSQPDKAFLGEVKWLFPEVADIIWQKPTTDTPEDTSNQFKTLVVTFKEGIEGATKTSVRARILRLAQNRFSDNRFNVFEKEPPPPAKNETNTEQSNANTTQPQ